MGSMKDLAFTLPSWQIAEFGPGEVPSSTTVASAIREHLKDDTKPEHNLGSFLTTAVDSSSEQIVLDNCCKNLVCRNEHPGVAELHNRCISILGNLWGGSAENHPVGSSTSGSSEAIFLGILALKRRWLADSRRKNKDVPLEPNIVVGSHAHVAVLNGASSCDVQVKKVHVSANSNFTVDPSEMEALIDDGTIGVVLVLGNTLTGHFDPVLEVSEMLDRHESQTGRNVLIHVDAASGGFVAPFLEVNRVTWDFSLPRIASINASGHKFGFASAAVGWILWRDRESLPASMIYTSDYHLGHTEGLTLSYSQPSHGVVLTYYNLARFGRRGFETLTQTAFRRATDVGLLLEKTGLFECIDGVHNTRQSPSSADGQETSAASSAKQAWSRGLPLVIFRVRDAARGRFPEFSETWLSEKLSQQGFSVPCYKIPLQSEEGYVLRLVMHHSITDEILDSFISCLLRLSLEAVGPWV